MASLLLLLLMHEALSGFTVHIWKIKPNKTKPKPTNKQNPTNQSNHKGVLDNFSSGNVKLQLNLTATIKHQHLASIIWALTWEKRNSKIFICKNQRTLLLASVKSKMLIKGLSELWNTHFPIKAKILTTTHTFLLLSSPASLNQFLNCLILWSKWLFESIRIQRSYEHQSLEWKIFPLLPFLDSSRFLKKKRALKKSPKHPYQFYAAHMGLTAHCFLQVIFLYWGPMLWNSATFLKYLHKFSASHTWNTLQCNFNTLIYALH